MMKKQNNRRITSPQLLNVYIKSICDLSTHANGALLTFRTFMVLFYHNYGNR